MKYIFKRSAKEIANSLSNTMNRELNKVQDVLDLDIDELIQVVNRLDNSKRDKVCSIMINNELKKLQLLTMEQYQSVSRDVDDITDYYASKKEEFDAVIEEGDTVANDILFKVIGKNGRKIKLPIKIKTIKEYCFSTELKKEQLYDALVWIALRYIAISRCLSWNEWLQGYENDKQVDNNRSEEVK